MLLFYEGELSHVSSGRAVSFPPGLSIKEHLLVAVAVAKTIVSIIFDALQTPDF